MLSTQTDTGSNELAYTIKADIDSSAFQFKHYDDVLVRKAIEWDKILSKEELSIAFKRG